jgi:hypothetical protein
VNRNAAEQRLPQVLLQSASLRGNEYAWHVHDIPEVIEAARQANLVNIGGQLQFRLPNRSTCECYWVQVNTYRSVPSLLTWQELVERTATVALADFSHLLSEFDFLVEGRRAFAKDLDALEQQGQDPKQTMCFVWYLQDADEAANQQILKHLSASDI